VAQVSPVRFSVTHITSDTPMIAELTVLPSTIAEGENLHGATPTARDALSQLRTALNHSTVLAHNVCGAVGLPSAGCNVAVTRIFRAGRQVQRASTASSSTSKDTSFSSTAVFVFFAVLAGFMVLCGCGGYFGLVCWLQNRSKTQSVITAEGSKVVDEEAPAKGDDLVAEGKSTAQKIMDPVVVQAAMRSSTFSDNASTATPSEGDSKDVNDAVSVTSDSTIEAGRRISVGDGTPDSVKA
jgi:hypothetical protein